MAIELGGRWLRVGGRLPVLERVPVRGVVAHLHGIGPGIDPGREIVGDLGVAALAVGEAPLEPAPVDAGIVEQVAEVAAVHGHRVAGLRADVVVGLRVADHRAQHIAAGGIDGGRIDRPVAVRQGGVIRDIDLARIVFGRDAQDAIDVGRRQVHRAARRAARHRGEKIVAHRKMLSVVPKGRHRIAVEVTHIGVVISLLVLHAELTIVGWSLGAELDELVHQALIPGLELVRVQMILIAGVAVEPRDPERVRLVGVVVQQGLAQAIDRRGAGLGLEGRRAGRILGHRVDAEVAVERVVLQEQHHQVLDGRRGLRGRGGDSHVMGQGAAKTEPQSQQNRLPILSLPVLEKV